MKLSRAFSRIKPVKILVIGDLILDTYTIGKVERISPEAPVGVVHVSKEEHRPGGAGNVALNLQALGAEVLLVGRTGFDGAADKLRLSLKEEGVDVSAIVQQNGYQTPVKNRIIAENQQIIRVDHEEIASITEVLEDQLVKRLPGLLKGVQAVAISDYGKGMLTPTLIQALIEESKHLGIPVIADPKGIDFTKYQGVTLLKPNMREAYIAANLDKSAPLEEVAGRIIAQSKAKVVMITRGSLGISLFFEEGSREDYKPFKVNEVKDVTGAGDTVLAMISSALASGLTPGESAQLANVAAGLAVEHFGCAKITLPELAKRLLEMSNENKVFDEEHLYTLKAALAEKSYSVVGIYGNPGMTPGVFQDIKKLKKQTCVLLYLRDEDPDDTFIDFLASLSDIDFIIRKKDSLQNFSELMRPESVYVADASGISVIENIQDIIKQ